MLPYKLLRLIETHSDTLAARLVDKVRESESARSFIQVPPEELKDRAAEIYQHLYDWLLVKTDADLRRRYGHIGARRYHQHVPLADVVWVMMLAKQNLWEFLNFEVVPERPAEVYGELDLLQLIGSFFDRAIHYAVEGYEQARPEERCDRIHSAAAHAA
jgi:hypothetical protein